MKRSTILCASVVALAVIAMSASGASAATYSTTKTNSRGKGLVTGPSSGGPTHRGDSRVNSELDNVHGPTHQDQSTDVNHSNSNIKNNMGVAPRMGGGGGGRTK
jgi:hypothetical protein